MLETDIEVTAQGLRVIFLDDDGMIPQTPQDREDAANAAMDVRNETGLTLPFVIVHEGTGDQSVSLTVSSVQEPDIIYPSILNSPEDQWSKSVNTSGPFTLSGQGTENDTVHVLLDLEDLSASMDGSTKQFAERYICRGRNSPLSVPTDRFSYATTDIHHRASRFRFCRTFRNSGSGRSTR